MTRKEVGRLSLRFLAVLALVICFVQLQGQRQAAAFVCNPNDIQACHNAGGRWYPTCCACGDLVDIESCEWDGMHIWNACLHECWLNQ